MQDTTELLKFAKSLAHQAGPIILKYFDVDDKEVQIKPDQTPTTIVDNLINQLVLDAVVVKFPNHGVLGEEASVHQDRTELWVCDPLDGTKSYLLHIPTAFFSLAYVVDGVPEVAVIYDPFQDKLYSAVRGAGAWVDDTPLKVSDHATLKDAHVAGPSGYNSLKKHGEVCERLAEQGAKQVIVPGCAFKSSLIANGGIEGYLFPGQGAHDIAAAKLIVEEAGGTVTNLRGEEQRYDQPIYGAILSNGHIHDELVRVVQSYGPENYLGY